MVDLLTLSENATVGGVAAGLVVSTTLAIISRKSKPPLELFMIDNKRAFLVNNCLRTVIFGEAYAFEQGTEIIGPNDGFRGHISEMRCSPGDGIVVSCKIRLGESLSLTYKPVFFGEPKLNRLRGKQRDETQIAEFFRVLDRNSSSVWSIRGILKRLEKHDPFEYTHPSRLFGWRIISLPLKPSQLAASPFQH